MIMITQTKSLAAVIALAAGAGSFDDTLSNSRGSDRCAREHGRRLRLLAISFASSAISRTRVPNPERIGELFSAYFLGMAVGTFGLSWLRVW